ncbi:Transcription factor-like 5 protein Cha transcription factor HPV-16 E2-binding protein 1 [Channa argus]|uniref:Transcription factor-like 5 protein Cha transcription factor HPV-16 E2-binding protein 1 n=1 Tax=Channa argus TaxID=215402 RepID=A0A6G1Q3M6_CHAAH|nr:Transcription factor-like 5 protein Cha transcription factor HPV-16 E2-binding protein 1 [Channa argus]
MPTFSSAHKTTNVSPSSREHVCDSVGLTLSQSEGLTHDQMHTMGNELGVMEMTEVEYTHLQQLIQAHMEAQFGSPEGADVRPHPATAMAKDATGSTGISPFTSTQAIDLTTSTDEHCLVMPGEKTPASYGEVPGHVLAKIRGEDSPNSNRGTSSQKRSKSAARVCLEKRFSSMAAESTRPQDIQSTVLNNFLTILQQSAEAQEAVIHPQMQKWMKTNRANPFEVSSPYVGAVFTPVSSMCGQMIGHIPQIIEPSKHQGSIIPKSFSFNFHPERIATKAHYISSSSQVEEQQFVNIQSEVVTPAAYREHDHACISQPSNAGKVSTKTAGEARKCPRKKAQPCASLNQRRERHNSKERERRKKIRLCCDELNMLVPFCDSVTDKVTTLQWTTAYLRYINKMYGDTFKEGFQKSLTDKKGLIFKPSTSSGPDTQELDETLSISFVNEQ